MKSKEKGKGSLDLSVTVKLRNCSSPRLQPARETSRRAVTGSNTHQHSCGKECSQHWQPCASQQSAPLEPSALTFSRAACPRYQHQENMKDSIRLSEATTALESTMGLPAEPSVLQRERKSSEQTCQLHTGQGLKETGNTARFYHSISVGFSNH